MKSVIPINELIARFALRENLSMDEARRFITTFFDTVEDNLAINGKVEIHGFGVFAVKGGKITFTPSEELAARANEPFEMFMPVEIDSEIDVEDEPEEEISDSEDTADSAMAEQQTSVQTSVGTFVADDETETVVERATDTVVASADEVPAEQIMSEFMPVAKKTAPKITPPPYAPKTDPLYATPEIPPVPQQAPPIPGPSVQTPPIPEPAAQVPPVPPGPPVLEPLASSVPPVPSTGASGSRRGCYSNWEKRFEEEPRTSSSLSKCCVTLLIIAAFIVGIIVGMTVTILFFDQIFNFIY